MDRVGEVRVTVNVRDVHVTVHVIGTGFHHLLRIQTSFSLQAATVSRHVDHQDLRIEVAVGPHCLCLAYLSGDLTR